MTWSKIIDGKYAHIAKWGEGPPMKDLHMRYSVSLPCDLKYRKGTEAEDRRRVL